MRSAVAGDGPAYHSLLRSVTPVLRGVVRRELARTGQPVLQLPQPSPDVLQRGAVALQTIARGLNAGQDGTGRESSK